MFLRERVNDTEYNSVPFFYRDEDNGKHEFASMFADDLILLPKRIHAFEYTFNGASYGVVST